MFVNRLEKYGVLGISSSTLELDTEEFESLDDSSVVMEGCVYDIILSSSVSLRRLLVVYWICWNISSRMYNIISYLCLNCFQWSQISTMNYVKNCTWIVSCDVISTWSSLSVKKKPPKMLLNISSLKSPPQPALNLLLQYRSYLPPPIHRALASFWAPFEPHSQPCE